MLQVVFTLLTIGLFAGIGLVLTRLSVARARSLWLATFVLVMAAGAAMLVTHAFITRWGLRTDSPRDGLWAMMSGRAARPFVYRRLAPDAVAAATGWIERLPAGMVDAGLAKLDPDLPIHPPPNRHETIAFWVALQLVWLGWFGTAIAGAALLRATRGCSWLEGYATATLAILLVPTTLVNGGYIYDPLEVLLWTCLVLCVFQGSLLAVPPLYLLLLFNKESELAMVPAMFPLFARRGSDRRAMAWTAGLGVASFAWLLFIRHAYAACPGVPQEYRLWQNLVFWSRPASYFKLGTVFSPGIAAPCGANVVIALLLLLPLRFGWRRVDPALRTATALGAAIMVPLFILSGCLDETRALGPLFPFLLVIGSEGVHQMFAPPGSAGARRAI